MVRLGAVVLLVLTSLQLGDFWPLGFRTQQRVPTPEPCRLGVSVSLLVSSVAAADGSTRLLEVRWRDASPLPGDSVAVFDEDPAGSSLLPTPLFSVAPQAADGSAKTAVRSKMPTDDIGLAESCFGHWAAYLRLANASSQPQLLASTCIRTRPTWMYDLAPQIGQKRLRDLFIPGTHDSGSFAEGEGDRLTKYTNTQEESVFQQLVFGCRYLDIRVGFYPPTPRRLDNGTWVQTTDAPDEDVFWLNHGVIKIRPLKGVLDEVKRFLVATQEVVIFDVQEFPVGFSGGLPTHVRLMAFLGREFEGLAANISMNGLGWDAPLNAFWSQERRLIIGYDDSEAREEAQRIAEAEGKGRGGSIIWKPVVQKWGDVRSAPALRDYLQTTLSSPPTATWAAMAELTPNAWDIIGDGPGGLRKMADAVNGNVSDWFSGSWGHFANVVATDYFRANEVVEAAIAWNFRRAVWSTECRQL